MFHGSKNVGGLRRFLAAKMNNYNTMVTGYMDQIKADVTFGEENGHVTYHHQAHWLAWHAVELAAQVVAANEASGVMVHLKDTKDEDAIPESIQKEALRNVLADMRLNGRSTSASSNLAEDAKRAFWVEVGSIVLTK